MDVLMDLMRETLPDFANGPLPSLLSDPPPRPRPTPKAPTKADAPGTAIPPPRGRTGGGHVKEQDPDDPPDEAPDQLDLF